LATIAGASQHEERPKPSRAAGHPARERSHHLAPARGCGRGPACAV